MTKESPHLANPTAIMCAETSIESESIHPEVFQPLISVDSSPGSGTTAQHRIAVNLIFSSRVGRRTGCTAWAPRNPAAAPIGIANNGHSGSDESAETVPNQSGLKMAYTPRSAQQNAADNRRKARATGFPPPTIVKAAVPKHAAATNRKTNRSTAANVP